MTDMHAVGRQCARAVGFTVASWVGILAYVVIGVVVIAPLWTVATAYREYLFAALLVLIPVHHFVKTMAREGAA